jgi:hypothetical protein
LVWTPEKSEELLPEIYAYIGEGGDIYVRTIYKID